MVLGIPLHRVYAHYSVATPVFEGPLDLLLHLIERAELDITKLALAQVTDQYLAHLHRLPESSPEEISAFLVIAARLIQIKSETLLPHPPVREQGEEDPAEALARQLIIYKRFKEIAASLAEREMSGLRTYLRLAPSPKIGSTFSLNDITLDDLLNAVYSIFFIDQKPALATVVTPPRITIREKIHQITSYLRRHQSGTFRQLLPRKSFRLEVVVTFLALLELVKRSLVQTFQDQLFGDIAIQPADTWDGDESFELEFGE